MSFPIAHGAGGGVDELLFLVALALLALGIVRLVDRKPRSKRWVGAALIVLALGVGAVPVVFRVGSPRTAATRIASTANVDILEPRSGARASGRFMEVVLRLQGGRVVQAASTRLRPDAGHLHLSVDGRLLSMTGGMRQQVDLSELEPGMHLLRVEFVATDHGPFNPPVVATMPFVVEETA